jgi:hypothetical protein
MSEVPELRIRVFTACEGVAVEESIPVLAEMLVYLILTRGADEATALEVFDNLAVLMRKRLKQGYADESWRGEPS